MVPSVWKLSQVVPIFKDGDPADPDRYRPISLASCAFKVFERLIHGRIAPHICNRLDDSQGGFRWNADACVYGLVDVSPPWVDTEIAQGRVLSPLLFNFLVNSLAAAIHRSSPGVRLVPSSDFRLTDQLYADDLVVLGESEADLQLALDAVTRWEDSGASHLVLVLRNRW